MVWRVVLWWDVRAGALGSGCVRILEVTIRWDGVTEIVDTSYLPYLHYPSVTLGCGLRL